ATSPVIRRADLAGPKSGSVAPEIGAVSHRGEAPSEGSRLPASSRAQGAKAAQPTSRVPASARKTTSAGGAPAAAPAQPQPAGSGTGAGSEIIYEEPVYLDVPGISQGNAKPSETGNAGGAAREQEKASRQRGSKRARSHAFGIMMGIMGALIIAGTVTYVLVFGETRHFWKAGGEGGTEETKAAESPEEKAARGELKEAIAFAKTPGAAWSDVAARYMDVYRKHRDTVAGREARDAAAELINRGVASALPALEREMAILEKEHRYKESFAKVRALHALLPPEDIAPAARELKRAGEAARRREDEAYRRLCAMASKFRKEKKFKEARETYTLIRERFRDELAREAEDFLATVATEEITARHEIREPPQDPGKDPGERAKREAEAAERLEAFRKEIFAAFRAFDVGALADAARKAEEALKGTPAWTEFEKLKGDVGRWEALGRKMAAAASSGKLAGLKILHRGVETAVEGGDIEGATLAGGVKLPWRDLRPSDLIAAALKARDEANPDDGIATGLWQLFRGMGDEAEKSFAEAAAKGADTSRYAAWIAELRKPLDEGTAAERMKAMNLSISKGKWTCDGLGTLRGMPEGDAAAALEGECANMTYMEVEVSGGGGKIGIHMGPSCSFLVKPSAEWRRLAIRADDKSVEFTVDGKPEKSLGETSGAINSRALGGKFALWTEGEGRFRNLLIVRR
ncbi:MAG: hypothetical protein N3A38_11020, partial [Planctomycetota bacterium]|nr:hypothetical protein [Planctomycetota bacterium]